MSISATWLRMTRALLLRELDWAWGLEENSDKVPSLISFDPWRSLNWNHRPRRTTRFFDIGRPPFGDWRGARRDLSHCTIFLIPTSHTFTSWATFANEAVPSTIATRKLAVSSGFRSRRTVPWDCPFRKSVATPSCQAMKILSNRLRNCSSSGDISCAKLSSGQLTRTSSGRAGIRRTIPIKMSMGFPSLSRGRNHLSRVSFATISSTMAYPRASLLLKW